jgi:hypothetical protein
LGYLIVQDNESAIFATVSTASLNFTGLYGGPFTAVPATYTLTNKGNFPLGWSAAKSQTWLTISPSSGVLAAGASATLTATINTNANILAVGSYSDTIIFDNISNGNGDVSRTVNLTVTGSPTLAISSAAFGATGFMGGPFVQSNSVVTVSNVGTSPLGWAVSKTAVWLNLSITNGTLAPGTNIIVTVSVNASANSLSAGSYLDTLSFVNTNTGAGNTNRVVTLLVKPAPTPVVAIAYTNNNVVLSWPTSFGGFSYSGYALQSTADLNSGSWSPVSPPATVVGGQYLVTNAISGSEAFYRLSQ